MKKWIEPININTLPQQAIFHTGSSQQSFLDFSQCTFFIIDGENESNIIVVNDFDDDEYDLVVHEDWYKVLHSSSPSPLHTCISIGVDLDDDDVF